MKQKKQCGIIKNKLIDEVINKTGTIDKTNKKKKTPVRYGKNIYH